MPSSSSSAQAARQRLADQLHELRTTARISGVEFARRAGWKDSSSVSKIERGLRPASADHVRLWCRICAASPQRTEALLAEQASVARMWVTYQQLNCGGLTAARKSVREEYEVDAGRGTPRGSAGVSTSKPGCWTTGVMWTGCRSRGFAGWRSICAARPVKSSRWPLTRRRCSLGLHDYADSPAPAQEVPLRWGVSEPTARMLGTVWVPGCWPG